MTEREVLDLLKAHISSERIQYFARKYGIAFDITTQTEGELRNAGAPPELVKALQELSIRPLPVSSSPALKLQVNEQRAENHMERADAAFLKRDWEGAINEYRQALRLEPDHFEAHSNLGVALFQIGDVNGAASEFRQAARLQPKSPSAHETLGVALGKTGDLEGGIAEERLAVGLKPDFALAHRELGAILQLQGFSKQAVQEEQTAIRLDSSDPVAHTWLGIALGAEGDWAGDIAQQREALRLQPGDADAHQQLGAALGRLGDWDQEIAEERGTLQINPNDVFAYETLSEGLERQGKWNDVVPVLRKATELAPKDANLHATLGVALELTGDKQAALGEYRTATTLKPASPTFANYYRGLAQMLGVADALNAQPPLQREANSGRPEGGTPAPAGVGDQIMPAIAVYRPNPVYPDLAKMNGIQGTVKLLAVIAKDGTTQNLKVVSGYPVLVKACLDALSNWRFQPTLLDGKPVEVAAAIDVNFQLGSEATININFRIESPSGRVTSAPDLSGPQALHTPQLPLQQSANSGQGEAVTPDRIRVGGQAMGAKALYKPGPVYPDLAKMARVQGTVRLKAIIATDGTIQSLQIISGHPLLVKAALDAVTHWRYQPTLLNGKPVEVETEIDVNFQLDGVRPATGDMGSWLYVSSPAFPLYAPRPPYTAEALKAHLEGTLKLELTIDAEGTVTKAKVVGKKLGNGLDQNAVASAMGWRFRPATQNGVPATSRVTTTVDFNLPRLSPRTPYTVVDQPAAQNAQATSFPGLPGPVYSLGADVKPPVPIYDPDPPYSEKARKAKYSGTVVLSVIVDPQGNVRDVQVTQPLGYGLDENAVNTVKTWKFTPATRNGVPVAVRMLVECTFRLW